MKTEKKGISLIALIITIAVLIIIAGATIQKGLQRTEDAKVARHNTDISTVQEEVESYYYNKGGELPIADLTPYPLPTGSSLYTETAKNGDNTDTFYKLDSSKFGKASGNNGTDPSDFYIVSATRHNVYYVKGIISKGLTYHGLVAKNDVKLAQVGPFANPPVPNGFTHVGEETWDTGFTIDDGNGNQFVWVPVLAPVVQANGTLDGTNFNSKFGRRRFQSVLFNASNYDEPYDATLQSITANVNTYGGFYIAKYEASQSAGGKAQSMANKTPWASITIGTAQLKAESMDSDWGWNSSAVDSYLCYGTHLDTTLQWLIDSGAKTQAEIETNSASWGNYLDDIFSGTTARGNTGQWSQTCAKGIYDLAGNVYEWTMEKYNTTYYVYRGGNFNQNGNNVPASDRWGETSTFSGSGLGFRVVLNVK